MEGCKIGIYIIVLWKYANLQILWKYISMQILFKPLTIPLYDRADLLRRTCNRSSGYGYTFLLKQAQRVVFMEI